MKFSALILGVSAALMATTAQAQTRAKTPQAPAPRAPSYQAPQIDPMFQRLNQIQAELDALKESAGKQVVVLHFSPTEHPGHLENNLSQNQAFATQQCEQVLGDRFGRMISYRIWNNGDRYTLTHIACETKL